MGRTQLPARRGKSEPARRRLAWFWGLYLALAVVVPMRSLGQGPMTFPATVSAGTADRTARKDAIRAIPWNQLSPERARQLQRVVGDPTIYRRLPSRVIECDEELYQFVTRNPDTLVALWEYMRITQISVRRTGPYTFESDDAMGTLSQFDLVYGRPELQIFVGVGVYEGPLFPGALRGHGVVLFRSRWMRTADGRTVVRSDMDAFVRIDSGPVDLMAKSLAPLFVKNADLNFVETADFVSRLSQTAQENPGGTQELIGQLRTLHPTVRDEFASVARRVASRVSSPEPLGGESMQANYAPVSTPAKGPRIYETVRPTYRQTRFPPDGPTYR